MKNKPLPGRDYRLLAIDDPSLQHFVGRLITVDTVDGEQPNKRWHITGRIHGSLGSFEITAALQHETGNCLCSAYDFPHRPGYKCKIVKSGH